MGQAGVEPDDSVNAMLSAYITAFGGKPIEDNHPVKFFLLALWHALCMSRQIKSLNHNQLDVWLSFMLELRSKMPAFKGVLDETLIDAAFEEIKGARINGKPHELALAYLMYSEVVLVTTYYSETQKIVHGVIRDAVDDIEKLIWKEPNQPQDLTQFVRVLRKAGELYMRPDMTSGYYNARKRAKMYLVRALELAQGEADCPDQVPKIEELLKKL